MATILNDIERSVFQCSLQVVRVCTGHEMSAQKETWRAHKFSFKKCFCTYFINFVPNISECWQNVAHRKFCEHTDFKKIRGNIGGNGGQWWWLDICTNVVTWQLVPKVMILYYGSILVQRLLADLFQCIFSFLRPMRYWKQGRGSWKWSEMVSTRLQENLSQRLKQNRRLSKTIWKCFTTDWK